MQFSRSRELYEEAQALIPGGVNSPVRAFKSVGGNPLFIKSGSGCRVEDHDGNRFIDYVCSWGPLILGHAHPTVIDAVKKAADSGTSFGAPTEGEVELARMIVDAVPSVDMVRLVNSGTEALMSASRVARGFTGRAKVIKFAGCYHGHSDGLLAKAGSGLATFAVPDSSGVPPSVTSETIVLPYNDIDSVHDCLQSIGNEVACILVEPVSGNMGVVPPKPAFLAGLRELCDQRGALLVFDEVITGFRVGYGGAQSLYGVMPDLTTLGKIIGGGLPVGAYGGRREVMEQVAPLGPVYQAGTLSGNPIAVAAGLATLHILSKPGFYKDLEAKASVLQREFIDAADESRIAIQVQRVGSMMTMFFSEKPISDFASACECDTARYAAFFRAALNEGVYFAPSQFEACFVSQAHELSDIEETCAAVGRAMRASA